MPCFHHCRFKNSPSITVLNVTHADDESKTSHTLAPVPFIVYNAECELKEGEDLGLSNVAATVCDFLGLEPNEHWNPSLKK